jgi:hypothetical protein
MGLTENFSLINIVISAGKNCSGTNIIHQCLLNSTVRIISAVTENSSLTTIPYSLNCYNGLAYGRVFGTLA